MIFLQLNCVLKTKMMFFWVTSVFLTFIILPVLLFLAAKSLIWSVNYQVYLYWSIRTQINNWKLFFPHRHFHKWQPFLSWIRPCSRWANSVSMQHVRSNFPSLHAVINPFIINGKWTPSVFIKARMRSSRLTVTQSCGTFPSSACQRGSK